MVDSKVTLRYARALFRLARERGLVEEVARDLETIASAFAEVRDLKAFLLDPRVEVDRKRAVAARWFQERVEPLTADFVDLVLARRREGVLLAIAEVFRSLVREAAGIVRAHVESAVPLDEMLLGNLRAKLEEMTGKHVELTDAVVPEILGGLRITVGNALMDGSLRRRLEEMRRHLISAEIQA
ncbi:MAG: ATP synthase F1 subunit delta [Planctomycetota bacterium]